MVVGTRVMTSRCPSRSNARISWAPQFDSHRRPSCQRADSPITRSVARTRGWDMSISSVCSRSRRIVGSHPHQDEDAYGDQGIQYRAPLGQRW